MALSERELLKMLNRHNDRRESPEDIPSKSAAQILQLLDGAYFKRKSDPLKSAPFIMDFFPSVSTQDGIFKPPRITAATFLAKPPFGGFTSPDIQRLVEETEKNPLPGDQNDDPKKGAKSSTVIFLTRIIEALPTSPGQLPSEDNQLVELFSLSFFPESLDWPLMELLASRTQPDFSEDRLLGVINIGRFCSTSPFVIKLNGKDVTVQRELRPKNAGLAYDLMNLRFLEHAKDWDIPIDYLTTRIGDDFPRKVSYPPLSGELVPPFVPAYKVLNLNGPEAIKKALARGESENWLTLQIMEKERWFRGLGAIINKVKYDATSNPDPSDAELADEVRTDPAEYSSLLQDNLQALIDQKGKKFSYLFKNPSIPSEKLHAQLLKQYTAENKVYINLGSTEVSEAIRTSVERVLADAIVKYGYINLYNPEPDKISQLGYDRLDNLDTTHTLVAVQEHPESFPNVWGTIRILTGNELEIFKLFRMKEGLEWPQAPKKAFQMDRFALHPVFDLLSALKDNQTGQHAGLLKRLILRKLWMEGIKLAQDAGGEIPYLVLPPESYEFFVSAGIRPQRVTGVEPNPSEYSQQIRTKHRGYWLPDAPEEKQPALYTAPAKIQPITWKLGDKIVTIV